MFFVIIRNRPVIADADVAALYGVQTKDINRAVRNNPDKFSPHYMFELTINELCDLRLKIFTTNVFSIIHGFATKKINMCFLGNI